MGIEIERKFLVDHLPPEFDDRIGATIRQGYIIVTGDGTELRVRQKQNRFFQTIKIGSGLSRTQIEIELTRDQFAYLWPFTDGRRLSKSRTAVPVHGQRAEVDRFDGSLAGLLLVEVEFESVDAARRFVPPQWFGSEVTEDARYSNKNLAFYGFPER